MNQLVPIKEGEILPPNQEHEDARRQRSIVELTMAMSAWYVRRNSKFYSVVHLNTKLSREDVERSCLRRFATEFPDSDISAAVLKEVFNRAINQKHSVEAQSIPTWNGSVRCEPGKPRFIWEHSMVTVNSWSRPAYRDRDVVASMGKAAEFFDTIFTREAERKKILDWLAWCLQNEGLKPCWAPFLYSAAKGSGKSTFCQLVSRLFGEQNTITQNNVDKLAHQFNATVLTSKLVISEELNLKADSRQGNALKTYLTEEEVTVERKGQESERSKQCCCFLFTTNHLPLWIEENDRRYYLVDIDHEGHASGPKAEEFSNLVGELKEEMAKEQFLAGLYKALMDRKLSDDFSAKTLNVIKDATPLMKKVHGASEQTTMSLMREWMEERSQHAVPESRVAQIIVEDLKGNPNTAKHLMTKLGWSKQKAKWGGADYSRSVWIEDGYWIDRGVLMGPEDYSQRLADHFEEPKGMYRVSPEQYELEEDNNPNELLF
ncbi:MAG: hypothetical protein HKN21_01650 [Candidatus Eisenbacteria bacterium]|uniref:NrS-1 polymerase-like helicase domain-containing protein n=1 Tax=Eiseniibacteriota bacterium TaxID=2212470 RepID=A0A7Y2E6V3_UNCEI|nr:hypothetical protein [Candidatus Eisenbacteria bacterium]